MGGWVYELKIRLNSASVGVELKLKLKLSLAKLKHIQRVGEKFVKLPRLVRCWEKNWK